MLKLPDLNRRPVFKFINKRSGPFKGKVKLTSDSVYIIPTKAGLIFSALLLTLLIGSINYEKNLGFILTFLLVGIGNISLLSTWRNIAGLELRSQPVAPVFCGENIEFKVQLRNEQLLDRHSIAISQHGIEYDIVDCKANTNKLIRFTIKSNHRGLLNAGKFRIYSEFPTGLFVAWTWTDLSMTCVTYPAPDANTLKQHSDFNEHGDNDHDGQGLENFSHIRKYQHGDNASRISWKATAKTELLFSKEFSGSSPVTHWINWLDISAQDNEQRLSIMAALIINAENRQQSYGIKLPEKQIQPGNGNKHFHQCLCALALF